MAKENATAEWASAIPAAAAHPTHYTVKGHRIVIIYGLLGKPKSLFKDTLNHLWKVSDRKNVKWPSLATD